MIKINGNLFDGEWDGMAHGCNLYAKMGAGIARQVKNIYPEAYEADQNATARLGSFSYCTAKDGADIFNLYTQEGIGNSGGVLHRNARYDAINDSLFRMCKHIMDIKGHGKYVLALPEIGCGLAGGEKVIVHAIMESVESMFPEIEFHLYIYEEPKK